MFPSTLFSFKCSYCKKEKLIQKGMNTLGTFCFLKTNSGTSYHYVIFFNSRLKKTHFFYLLITCSHSANLTVLMMYQFRNFIHNEQTGVPHPRKALCLTIIIFHSEKCVVKKTCTSLWVLPTSVYK